MPSEQAASPRLRPRRRRKSLKSPAERRPITVMFCDLVGSTSLAAKLDAEDWRNLVGGYLDEASAAVTGARRPCAEKARRRADGAVRLSAGAGERRRARGARRARDPARARRPQRAQRRQRRAGACRAHRPRERAGRGRRDRRGVRRCAERRRAGAERRRAGSGAGSPRDVQRQIAGLFVAEDKGAHELKGVPEPQLYRIVRARRRAARRLARADAAGRPRGGTRPPRAPLGARARRRGAARR